ncbi:stage II sporulation protein P [Sinanaerobacter sp. ZZT-01]|uniref:stage II sporulation protein P n=1 Tax=Sinanaerobacter sp. ZZT-01 TaxID=3111540 RepID=UPI002D7982C1|nr:stage II sporulation protein P [Sinanaerobacter sp. ZZT-01]WRR92859.1 stage II sporulation protein P [Sinanaerobacter sp. ZZT-01]
MRRRRYASRAVSKGGIVVVAFLCFFLAAATELYFMDKDAGRSEQVSETFHVQDLFSSVNRGSKGRRTSGDNVNRSLKGVLQLSFPSLSKEDGDNKDDKLVAQNENIKEDTDDSEDQAVNQEEITEPAKEEPEAVAVLDTEESKNPVVLIVHTHATESYQPMSEGNFHRLEEAGTVREVGNILTKELEQKGIPVIHDKTLHDSPSYNQSYARSLQTLQSYLAKNPSIKIVIDLHRDAAAYAGNVGKTMQVQGSTIAKYSLVIGKGNANYDQLKGFANQINAKADQLYPGFSGRIIEKEYRFNEYVSDHYLLLEVGNNENTIDQAKLTGKYFADVLASYIQEME